MKTLFICEYFAPYSTIASVRLTKLAKYLRRQGYDIVVVAKWHNENLLPRDNILERDLKEIGEENVHFIMPTFFEKQLYRLAAFYRKKVEKQAISNENSSRKTIASSIIFHAYFFLEDIMDYSYFHKNKRKIERIVQAHSISHIFSSYGPLSSHRFARWLVQKNPDMRWVADFRDPVTAGSRISQKIFFSTLSSFEEKTLLVANAATVVGQEMANRLRPYSRNVFVLRNGYDSEDIEESMPNNPKPHDKMRLSYAGLLYDSKSDLRPIFLALDELIREGKVDSEKILIQYVGKNRQIMQDFLVDFPALLSGASIRESVPRHEAVALLAESDLLLLASWNTIHERGMVSGKVYEYMMMEKPIITIVAGDVADSELKRLLLPIGQECVYEEASKEADFPLLKGYLLHYYHQFLEHGFVLPVHAKEKTTMFSYQNHAHTLAKILEES